MQPVMRLLKAVFLSGSCPRGATRCGARSRTVVPSVHPGVAPAQRAHQPGNGRAIIDPHVVSTLVFTLLRAHSTSARAGCVALATVLEHHIQDLEADKLRTSHNLGDGDGGDQGLPLRRGRALHQTVLSENEILEGLHAFCAHVGTTMATHEHAHGERLREDCQQLLSQENAEALESHIFGEGSRGLALAWCVDIVRVCSSHAVVDAGEL